MSWEIERAGAGRRARDARAQSRRSLAAAFAGRFSPAILDKYSASWWSKAEVFQAARKTGLRVQR
jgi:hypothetical protein